MADILAERTKLAVVVAAVVQLVLLSIVVEVKVVYLQVQAKLVSFNHQGQGWL
jgi:hypothetical protein